MKTRVVHQTCLVLIACLITFGLSGISYAQKNGHPPWVWSVAYSPDGGTLASGSTDETIRLWDIATGEVLATLSGHTNEVYSVAYSPNGRTLASGSRDNTVRLWDVATGEILATLSGHTKAITSVAYAPAGGTLASGGYDNNGVRFWDIASYTGGEPTAVAETSWGRIKSLLSVP